MKAVPVGEHLRRLDREVDVWLETFEDERDLLEYVASWQERRTRLGTFDPCREGTYCVALCRRWRRLHEERT